MNTALAVNRVTPVQVPVAATCSARPLRALMCAVIRWGWCKGTGCKYSTVNVRVTAGVPAIHSVKPSTSSQAAATAPPCAKPGAPM
ncbi:Uncharacterised protein [Mycobacteroides abscessus subsp. abscessus]|nr:Uncharacterised protein [Mycobacteroides abscessus subsp. abscessus]